MLNNTEDILRILSQEKPVSIIRSGDGERLVLESMNNFTSYRKCVNEVMVRQLGYEPTMTEVQEIRDNLIQAYNGADIIGIPDHKNLDSLSSDWRFVEDTLDKYCPTRSDNKCSTNVAYHMLEDGTFDKLLRDRDYLCYISCRQLEEKISSYFNIRRVYGYHLPPEMKFTSGYEGDKYYPVIFNKAARWMEKCVQPGALLLVGGGVVGKIYCNWWRDKGGVAIDIGSVFDELDGRVTRGKDRALDKIEKGRWTL